MVGGDRVSLSTGLYEGRDTLAFGLGTDVFQRVELEQGHDVMGRGCWLKEKRMFGFEVPEGDHEYSVRYQLNEEKAEGVRES